MTPEQRDREMRRLRFRPCETKEELSFWFQAFLGLDFPDGHIDPESNSSPMELAWEVYDLARKGGDAEVSRILAVASRGSFKTLVAAALEVVMMLHCLRSPIHLAAILEQSQKAQEYVRKFFETPYLREFKVGDNQRDLVYVRYQRGRDYADNITEKQWRKLDAISQSAYSRIQLALELKVCTLQGVNSGHSTYMCVSGDTGLLVKADGEGNRERVSRGARGIFRRLAGRKPGGRTGGEEVEEILNPAERIDALTLNFSTGDLEFCPITAGYCRKAQLLRIRCDDGIHVDCTPDHPLYVFGKGFVLAAQIRPGDRCLYLGKMRSRSGVGSEQKKEELAGPEEAVDRWDQVILGGLLGDCGVYKKPENNPFLQEQHAKEQAAYLTWKRSIISEKVRTADLTGAKSGYTGEEQVGFRTGNSPLLLPYVGFREHFRGVERLGPLGLAVWYMDDGCAGNGFRLSTESFTEEQNHFLKCVLKRNFGIEVEVSSYDREGKPLWYLHGGIEPKRRLVELCQQHVHPDLAYKFDLTGNHRPCVVCGTEFWFYEAGTAAKSCSSRMCRAVMREKLRAVAVTVVEDLGQQWVYDFTVEGNHNFFSNSLLSKNCVDEVDVVQNPKAYNDAKLMPKEENGQLPLTLLISTRKTAVGKVQTEIDESPRTKLQIRRWNIMDITRRCESDRHLPDRPKIQLYVNEDALESMSEAKWRDLPANEQEKFQRKEGFEGCGSCRLFPMCQGRLATEQKSTARLLNSITSTIQQFRDTDVDLAHAQLLCRKPSSHGLIYPRLDRRLHVKSAEQIWEMVTGEPPRRPVTVQTLIALLHQRGAKFWGGIDFGYTAAFSLPVGAELGHRMFVLDAIELTGLEPEQQKERSEYVQDMYHNPGLYPDTEVGGGVIRSWRRAGFKMMSWDKGKGSVLAGIEAVKTKLRPAGGEPELFFLDCDRVNVLVHRLSRYHWKMDALGRITDEPDKGDPDAPSDACDGLRYMVMNRFPVRSQKKRSEAEVQEIKGRQPAEKVTDQQKVWARQISEEVGVDLKPAAAAEDKKIRNGRFFFSG